MGKMRHIVVVAYDPGWAKAYQAEAARLAAVFGQELVSIHHIGSTSVPGLPAKPIIDIMPVVRDITRVDVFNPAMIELGYEPRGEWGIPGRRYFSKRSDVQRTHHVHTFAQDSPEVARHLDFRDFLSARPEAARQYGELKLALARQFPHDIDGYMAGKDGFIKEIIRKAQARRESGPVLPPHYAIRLATEADLPELAEIERRAAIRFAPFGLAELFSRVVTPALDLRAGQAAGRLWVAVDRENRPVGFALGDVVGENAHLDELDVLPEHGRRGLGRALVEAACDWARNAGYRAITLTTLSHIPWNGPFYERLGFRSLAPAELTAEQHALLRREIEAGLPAENRVVMRREL